MIGYEQKVTQPENWLTDMAENDRQFVKVIRLPFGEAWAECTDAEKEAWESSREEVQEGLEQ